MLAEHADPTEALSKLRIAVADDNAAMRGIVRAVLASLGCDKVYEAADANAALSLLQSQQIDILVLDWKMQPMDGLELVKLIRDPERSPNPFLPVIMLTAYGEPSKVREARDAGVTEFMVKPFNAEALYRRLAVIVNRPRPFVRTKAFFGPDRRRLEADFNGPERRDEAPIS
ncbi:response regulator [Maricaulaceae bacterium MS644]